VNVVRNLPYLRALSTPEMPGFGAKLVEALQDLITHHANLTQQVNGNSAGQPQAPPQVNGLTVSGQNGHFSGAIQDNNPIYRGIQYYVEHDTDPNFSNPTVVHLGDSRNFNMFLGSGKRYWRAYSAYGSSSPSKAVYHGGQAAPVGVEGGGNIGGPAVLPSQSSGTGTPGQGLVGPGITPFRSTSGVPPIR